ncbi:hypothetical protein MBLNU230_g5707t1 [Neophaeotheca triangularis]
MYFNDRKSYRTAGRVLYTASDSDSSTDSDNKSRSSFEDIGGPKPSPRGMWSKKFRKTLEQDEPPLTPVAGVYDEGAGSSSAADGADGLTQGIVASAEAAEAAATEQLAMSGAGAATARKADVEPVHVQAHRSNRVHLPLPLAGFVVLNNLTISLTFNNTTQAAIPSRDMPPPTAHQPSGDAKETATSGESISVSKTAAKRPAAPQDDMPDERARKAAKNKKRSLNGEASTLDPRSTTSTPPPASNRPRVMLPDATTDVRTPQPVPRDRARSSQVSTLREEMKQLQIDTEAKMRKLGQDMILQKMMHQKQVAKLTEENMKLLSRNMKQDALNRETVEQLNSQIASQREGLLNAEADSAALVTEAEHMDRVLQMMHEDVAELRRIENEESQRRLNAASGLPPAYGSLDEEDQLPPWRSYEDSGIADIATLKRDVREVFDTSYHQAIFEAKQMREGHTDGSAIDRKLLAESHLLVSISQALSTVCSRLQEALNRAPDINVLHQQLVTKDGMSTENQIKTQTRKTAFIADRITKLIIDLCWRTLAALEIRPTSPKLTTTQKARVKLAYAQLDNTLYAALTTSFNLRPSPAQSQLPSTSDADPNAPTNKAAEATAREEKVWTLHAFDAQLTALLSRLVVPYTQLTRDRHPLRGVFFPRTLEWIGDTIDKERELAAHIRDAPAVSRPANAPRNNQANALPIPRPADAPRNNRIDAQPPRPQPPVSEGPTMREAAGAIGRQHRLAGVEAVPPGPTSNQPQIGRPTPLSVQLAHAETRYARLNSPSLAEWDALEELRERAEEEEAAEGGATEVESPPPTPPTRTRPPPPRPQPGVERPPPRRQLRARAKTPLSRSFPKRTAQGLLSLRNKPPLESEADPGAGHNRTILCLFGDRERHGEDHEVPDPG